MKLCAAVVFSKKCQTNPDIPMVVKTRGLVLNYIKYRDTSIIVRMYTEHFGMQSYIVNGIRSARSKKSIGLYQPFSRLEIVAYYKENKDIHHLSEARIATAISDLTDVRKSTVIIFLSEILGKLLFHEKSENPGLFDFLWQSSIDFEQMISGIEYFHIKFLLHLTIHLGIDMRDRSVLDEITHGDPDLINFFEELDHDTNSKVIESTSELRSMALDCILELLSRETDSLSSIKSLKVLRQVFA